MTNNQRNRQNEKGNVLFLILIAVALFAALSYVVTQSTRSGSGSTEREKNILSGASMTQYPTALRTALIRMVLGGSSIENVKFDLPGSSAFSTSTNRQVFHPTGGGALYQTGPADLSASGTTELAWYFNANFDVPDIGLNGVGGNDVIAFLPGVSIGVCRQVNKELGISASGCTGASENLPLSAAGVLSADIEDQMDDTYTFPTTDRADLQANGCTAFTRQASGCFLHSSSNKYVFYSVLLER